MQELIDKMYRLIKTSRQEHKALVGRYLSLGNAVLFKEFSNTHKWSYLAAIEQLHSYYEQKFNQPLYTMVEAVKEVV